jgi:hypothetical protein
LPGASTLSVSENTTNYRTELTINTGGRPIGSTNQAIQAQTLTIILALTEAAQLYTPEKKIVMSRGKRVYPMVYSPSSLIHRKLCMISKIELFLSVYFGRIILMRHTKGYHL